MAFWDPNDEDEDQLAQGPQPTTGPQSGVINPGVQSTPQKNAPDSPGNFVGIEKYLQANKNQAENLGQQAANVIGDSANKAKSSISSLQGNFNQAVGNPTTLDPNSLNKINTGAEKLGSDELSGLKSIYNSSYSGPKDLTDERFADQYSGAQKKLGQAKQNVTNANTESGRQSLISQINNKDRSLGATTFDSILLSSGGGRQKIADAAKANQDLVKNDLIAQANTQAAQKSKSTQDQILSNKSSVKNATDSALKNFESSLQQKLQQERQGLIARNQATVSDATDWDLNPETLAILQAQGPKNGMAFNEGLNTYGVGLSGYVNQADPSQINNDNVANDDEYARYLALSDLQGTAPTILDPQKRNLAGTSSKIAPSFNLDGLSQAIRGQENAFNNTYENSNGTQFLPAWMYQPPEIEIPMPPEAILGDPLVQKVTGRSLTSSSPKVIAQDIIPKLFEAGMDKPGTPGDPKAGWIDAYGRPQPIYTPGSRPAKPAGPPQRGNPIATNMANQLKYYLDEFVKNNKKDTIIKKSGK